MLSRPIRRGGGGGLCHLFLKKRRLFQPFLENLHWGAWQRKPNEKNCSISQSHSSSKRPQTARIRSTVDFKSPYRAGGNKSIKLVMMFVKSHWPHCPTGWGSGGVFPRVVDVTFSTKFMIKDRLRLRRDVRTVVSRVCIMIALCRGAWLQVAGRVPWVAFWGFFFFFGTFRVYVRDISQRESSSTDGVLVERLEEPPNLGQSLGKSRGYSACSTRTCRDWEGYACPVQAFPQGICLLRIYVGQLWACEWKHRP